MPDGVEIRTADSEDDREACRRFWFDVFTEELGRPYARRSLHVDHGRRSLRVQHDEEGAVLMATRDGQVLGTVLCVLAREIPGSSLLDLHAMHRVGANHPARTSVTTKLAVRADLRGGPLPVRLAVAAYCHYLLKGVRHTFIICDPALVPLYRKLGFNSHRGTLDVPGLGRQCSMALDLRDEAHLAAVGSPFLPVLRSLSGNGIAEDDRAGSRSSRAEPQEEATSWT